MQASTLRANVYLTRRESASALVCDYGPSYILLERVREWFIKFGHMMQTYKAEQKSVSFNIFANPSNHAMMCAVSEISMKIEERTNV